MSKNTSQISPAMSDLQKLLDSMAFPYSIHVNGKEHPGAVLTVDFGAPLQSVRLNSEQNQELAGALRRAAKEVMRGRENRDMNIRVSSDNYGGLIYWASVQF